MNKAFAAAAIVWVLMFLASGGLVVGVIYVIWHFVKKFW